MRPSIGPSHLALLLFVLLIPLRLVGAVYQDEAYQIDFEHTLLGAPIPENTFFFRPSASSKATLLYSLSEKNVVGAINPKDGTIVWRHVLDEQLEAGGKGFLRAAEGQSFVVTAAGNAVQAWEASDGKLLWDYPLSGQVKGLTFANEGSDVDPVVLYEDGGKAKITKIGAEKGQMLWEITETSGDTPFALTASPTHIYYIAFQSAFLKGHKTRVVTIDSATGKNLEQKLLSSDGELSGADSFLHIGSNAESPALVWADKSFKSVKINVLGTSNTVTVNTASFGDDPVQKVTAHAPRSGAAKNQVLIAYHGKDSNWAEVYEIDPKTSAAQKSFELPKIEGAGAFGASSVQQDVFFTRVSKSGSTCLRSSNQKVVESNKLRSAASLGNVERLVSEVVMKGADGFAIRSAALLSDGDVGLLRGGSFEWTRYESLAGIVAATWADLPFGEDLARELAVESYANPIMAYASRVKRHVRDLQYLSAWLQTIPGRIASSFAGGEITFEGQPLLSDSFGFRKVIVAATESGRLVAMDAALQGKVIWSIKAVDLGDKKWKVTGMQTEDDVVLVMAANAEFVVVEALTGKILKHQPGGVSDNVARFLSLPKSGGQRSLIPIKFDGTPGEIPKDAATNTTFLVSQKQDGTLMGWGVSGGKVPSISWSFSAPPGEEIVGVASRPLHDPVASIGRALGDRNVLYKYLSPNLVVAFTAHHSASTLAVHLLDSVTGTTLYTTTHSGVDTSQEVSSTFSENWFAYTFFSDPALASETAAHGHPKANLLVVSELFESSLPNDRGALDDAASFSSLSSPPSSPHVLSAAYVLSAPLTNLTTTSTRQGITPRSILAYSPPLAAVLAIPFPFLSPRKPVGRDPTATEREEGLFRYSPLLELDPRWALSHAREVLGVEGFAVAPTLMESSSVVFAFGRLDAFGTRVAPIGAFDVLGKGFGRVQLVLTVLALTVGTAFLAPMVRKKQVDTLWQN